MDDGADGTRGRQEADSQAERSQTRNGSARNGVSRRAAVLALGAGGLNALAGCLGLGQEESGEDTEGNESNGATATPTTEVETDAPTDTETRTEGDDGTQTEDTEPEPFRIGMLQPLSGALSDFGEIAMQGFYSYFGYRGVDIPSAVSPGERTFEIDGTEYVVDLRDTTADPQRAQSLAQMLAEDATVLAGGAVASVAFAIAEGIAANREIPYVAGPTPEPSLTNGSEPCSEAVFRASETLPMDAAAGGRYLGDDPAIDSVAIYHADFTYGEAVRDSYERVLGNNGVTVAETEAFPLGYDGDWAEQFEQAASQGVDAVVAGVTVQTLVNMVGPFLNGGYDLRLQTNWGNRLASEILSPVVADALGTNFTAADLERAGLGPFTTRYHWNQYDNDIAREVTELHRDVYGTNPDTFTSGMFTAASALVQAVEQGDARERADVISELTGMRVDATLKGEGGYEFQEYNNQARSAMTVAPLVPTERAQQQYWGESQIQPGDPVTRFDMDETTTPARLTDCTLN